MAKHLLLFTITPVQSFIAQARKAQDLYAGSQMLSDLIDFAIEEAKEATDSFDLIFPNIETHTKPNRFVAEIEYSDLDKIKKVSNKVKKKLIEWAELYFESNQLVEFSKLELENILKPYWAIKKLSSDYLTTYKELENLLGSIKNQRYFEQLEETGRKCSLNGEYNVKIYRKSISEKSRPDKNIYEKKLYHNNAVIINFNDETLYKYRKIEPGEGLSAISFLKRVYKEKQIENFPSTAKIALLKELHNIENADIQELDKIFNQKEVAKELIENGGKINFNGQDWVSSFNTHFFYEENINKKQIPNEYQRKAAKKQLEKIKKITKLSLKYYAVVRLDVDNMGKWLIDENATKDYHQKISAQLKEFANWVKDYVDGKDEDKIQRGRTIYSGGDDILLFVNLHHLFKTVERIRSKFNEFLNEYDGLSDFNIEATLSGSIVIAHYTHPLEDVLNWSNKLEKQAKEVDGKNAFAFAVLKHSGEIHSTVSKWSNEDKNILDNWQAILNGLYNEDFSSAFIKNLGESLKYFMVDKPVIQYEEISRIAKAEIKRLVARACIGKKEPNETKKEFEKRIILPFTNNIDNLLNENTFRKDNLMDFRNSLYIIDFIYRKLKNYDTN